MSAFGAKQGKTAPSGKDARGPVKSGTPKTGFTEAPKGGCGEKGPGPGVGNSRRGIH